ncbi:MAG: peptide chain release factor 1 [Magnetococcales bacterium]|nr:peptide chain release factor 1 [Magnetococcales bacterium]|tara:strand:+ start:33252 stop:34328 length:1077 start_codon:yes stop_codon:yes gene_type:complete
MNILPKLEAIEARHKKLAVELSQPEATNDMEKFTSLNKEYAELTPVVDKFKVYRELLKERDDLNEMIEDGSDAEMAEMAEMELGALQKKIPAAEEELKLALIPKDAADDKNVIIEIRAGTGGDEAALFAADMFRMYSMYAEKNRWKVEELSRTETALGGIREIVANIAGPGVFAKMKFESGVHRVQRVPDTETQGRIHTSACTVAVLPEAEEVDVNIEAKDIRIDVFRASGPGGQSVNTTDSAVRITHLPTGIVVSSQDEKSQHKNKEKGMKILLARVLDHERAIVDSERAADRKSQVGSGDRSERIRTYNYPQGRISDHRINLTLHNLSNFMNGDLDEMFNSLIREDQMAKLSSLEE